MTRMPPRTPRAYSVTGAPRHRGLPRKDKGLFLRAWLNTPPGASPHPAHGALPTQVDAPLAGRDSHPLDEKRGFMASSHTPLLLDQPVLVVLNILSFQGRANGASAATAA